MARMAKDFKGEISKGEEYFLEQYKHPFLVLIKRFTDVSVSNTDFETTNLRVPNLKELGALATGRKLEHTAPVYDLIKRDGANPYAAMITVGRVDNCDIVIRSSGISKFHAYFMTNPTKPGQYDLYDADSSNGTTLNSAKLEPKKRAQIENNDIIELGSDVILRFYLPADFLDTLRRTF